MILHDLQYDFSQFTLTGFIEWLEHIEQREFYCRPASLPHGVFGAWVTGDREEYILFDENGAALHQTHNILHEICHWLLGHTTFSLSAEDGSYTATPPASEVGLMIRTPEQELEAETLSSLIVNEVQRHRRRKLTVRESRGLYSFFKALDDKP